MQLDFWFDFSCPYAYLASQQLDALIAGRQVELRYQPMLLGGVFRAIGAGDGPMPTLADAKRDHLAHDLTRWADRRGMVLRTPAAHPMRTVRALRTLLGLPEPTWPAAIRELYAAYWQRGEDLTREDVLRATLQRCPLTAEALDVALAGADDEARKQALRTRTERAVELGVFGAPAFVVHGAGAPRLIWGQDRLPWVAALLDGWQPPAPPPSQPAPAAATPAPAPAPARQLDFYFDTASPYAYLGLTQIARVARGHQLRLRPILLGGLFRSIGTPDVPLMAFPEAKRRYLFGELAMWSAWWSVPFSFPSKFPQRTTMVQRILLELAEAPARQLQLALAFARAMWAQGRDLEDEAVIEAILVEHGESTDRIAGSKAPQAKARLIEATTAAAAAGVFGVPTCVLDDGAGPRRFWGQDRLELVSAALAGWRAPGD